MWLPYEGTLDCFNLSLLSPICPFHLVLSSEHLHCTNRMYLNIYFEVRNYQTFAASKISESITIQHLSVLIRYRSSPY